MKKSHPMRVSRGNARAARRAHQTRFAVKAEVYKKAYGDYEVHTRTFTTMGDDHGEVRKRVQARKGVLQVLEVEQA